MSKYSSFVAKYGNKTGDQTNDIIAWNFHHVNTTKNILAECKNDSDVRIVINTVFPNDLLQIINFKNINGRNILEAFGAIVAPNSNKHYTATNSKTGYTELFSRSTNKIVARKYYGAFYAVDNSGNIKYRATFKRAFYALADSPNGFHTSGRLDVAIMRSKACNKHFEFYCTMTPIKAATVVK